MITIKACFRQEKETKGAIRFKEITMDGVDFTIAEGAVLGTLYIRKTAFGAEGAPGVIAIVIKGIDMEKSND